MFPVDPWAPTIDSQSIASQIFAVYLFPYIGFLYFLTKSKSAPKLTLFGFYFLLAFAGATNNMDPYVQLTCRTQEQKSSISAGRRNHEFLQDRAQVRNGMRHLSSLSLKELQS